MHLITLNDTHTRSDSSGRGIRPSQRPLPAQHTTFTRDKEPCPQRDSNPQSQPTSGRRLTLQTARPPRSARKVPAFEIRQLIWPEIACFCAVSLRHIVFDVRSLHTSAYCCQAPLHASVCTGHLLVSGRLNYEFERQGRVTCTRTGK